MVRVLLSMSDVSLQPMCSASKIARSLQGAAANFLTNNVYDPNGMPEYKVCAVRIVPG